MSGENSKSIGPSLPGLLGDKDMILSEDNRVDPRIVKVLAPFGLDGAQPASTTPRPQRCTTHAMRRS